MPAQSLIQFRLSKSERTHEQNRIFTTDDQSYAKHMRQWMTGLLIDAGWSPTFGLSWEVDATNGDFVFAWTVIEGIL